MMNNFLDEAAKLDHSTHTSIQITFLGTVGTTYGLGQHKRIWALRPAIVHGLGHF